MTQPALVINNLPSRALAERHNVLNLFDKEGNIRSLHEIEREVISAALEHYNGHISEVARRLKLSRSTLYRKICELKPDGVQADSGKQSERELSSIKNETISRTASELS